MARRKKVHAVLLNPIFIVLPLVVLLLLSWNHFVVGNHDLSVPTENLLPSSQFETLGTSGVPSDWQLTRSGSLLSNVSQTNGYARGKSLKVTVSKYQNGDLELRTPQVTLSPQKTYLFKGFYSSTSGLDLLARYHYRDGRQSLEFLRSYPATASSWSTASAAFGSSNDVAAVQFVFRLSHNGQTRFNGFYLEPNNNVVTEQPLPTGGKNLIPNAEFASASAKAPLKWSPYRIGKNQAAFAYNDQDGRKFVQASINGHQSGEAKWQYHPQKVSPGQQYIFGVNYRSTAHADIVAEYMLGSKKYKFNTLATLTPAGEWTHVTEQVVVPPHAVTMIVSVVLHHNGSVATSGYTLNNNSVPGLRAWQQPIVSLAFGDGWQSAYEEASPMLGQFKLPATFYINPGTIDTRHFISDDQIKDLAGNGNEVTSEGFDRIDLTSLDSTHLQAELKNSYELLRTNFGEKSLDFAAPFGNVDPQVDYYARKIYRSELGNATGINTPQTFDPYNLKVTYITANTTTAELQTLLKQVKNEKGWLILVYHQVTNKPFDGAPAVSTAAFLQQLKTIQQSGIGVDTVAAAVSSLEQQTAQAAAGTHRTAANGTHLQRPTVIPNTGAGNMIDLFLTAAVGGAGIHSLLSSWLAHRNK